MRSTRNFFMFANIREFKDIAPRIVTNNRTTYSVKTPVLLLFLFSASLAFAQSGWQTYPYSPSASVLSFPADDGYHPDPSTKTEWWYINLHLIGSAPQYKKYDVMLVYFRFANMRIFNISESSGTFHSNVLQAFPNFTFQPGKWDLTYTVPFQISDYSKWTFPVNSKTYSYYFYAKEPTKNDVLDVTVTSNRPPLVVGGDGFVALGEKGDSSFYYSYTNMKVEGTIRYNGVNDSITSGIGWIDRQWGPFTVGVNSDNKYEWFSMQVDQPGAVPGIPQTPSEFNIWQIFSDSSSIPYKSEWRTVSCIFPDNTQDTSSTFFYERTGYWHDATNNKYYSNGWRLIEPKHGVNLYMIPDIANQVIDVTLFKFWEGSTTLKGTVNNLPAEGVGFAELVADHAYNILTPSVPAGLSVSATANHYSLNWTASVAGTYPVGGYRVYRSPTNNGYWQYLATTANLSYDDYSVSTDTSYYYTVTSFDNQTATSASQYAAAVKAFPLGITPVENDNDLFTVYPNPTSGKVAVSSSYNINAIEINNVLGANVYQSSVIRHLPSVNKPFTIDLSFQPKGIYVIKIVTEKNVGYKKLVVE